LKRFVSLFFVFVFLFLAACSEPPTAASLLAYEERELRLELVICSGGVVLEGTLERSQGAGGERMTLSFRSPESLRELSFVREGGELIARHAGEGDRAASSEVLLLPSAVFDCFSVLRRHSAGELDFVSTERAQDARLSVFSGGGVRYEIEQAIDGELPRRIVRQTDSGEPLELSVSGSR